MPAGPASEPPARTGTQLAELLQDAATTFGMLSVPVRLQMVCLLGERERDVGNLAEQTGQRMATISHHLGKLKLAGLVRARREGRHQVYFLDDRHIVEIARLALDHHAHAGNT